MKQRTSSEYVGYGLYLYFLGLSTRKVAKVLLFLHIVKRNHMYQSGSGSGQTEVTKLSSKKEERYLNLWLIKQ